MIISHSYVAPPKRERPLDFRQPFGQSNADHVLSIDQNKAMIGVPDPVRVSVQVGIRHAVRVAHMHIFISGKTPEVNGGWVDSFAPFAAKMEYAQNIDTTAVGAGIHGQLPWLEKTNVRKPRSQTFSRLMDLLTGQN